MKIFSVVNLSKESPQTSAFVESSQSAFDKINFLFSKGTDYVDIGGRSSYSQSIMIDEALEQKRLTPLFELLKQHNIGSISLDTWSAETALRYLNGIAVLNYTSTEFTQPLITALADSEVKLVINYLYASNPYALRTAPYRAFELQLILDYFAEKVHRLTQQGVAVLAIDPNLGMWHPAVPNEKKTEIQQQIIECIPQLKKLAPVFIVAPRTAGSLNTTLTELIIEKGADFLRTHDLEHVQGLVQNQMNSG